MLLEKFESELNKGAINLWVSSGSILYRLDNSLVLFLVPANMLFSFKTYCDGLGKIILVWTYSYEGGVMVLNYKKAFDFTVIIRLLSMSLLKMSVIDLYREIYNLLVKWKWARVKLCWGSAMYEISWIIRVRWQLKQEVSFEIVVTFPLLRDNWYSSVFLLGEKIGMRQSSSLQF